MRRIPFRSTNFFLAALTPLLSRVALPCPHLAPRAVYRLPLSSHLPCRYFHGQTLLLQNRPIFQTECCSLERIPARLETGHLFDGNEQSPMIISLCLTFFPIPQTLTWWERDGSQQHPTPRPKAHDHDQKLERLSQLTFSDCSTSAHIKARKGTRDRSRATITSLQMDRHHVTIIKTQHSPSLMRRSKYEMFQDAVWYT